jgi:hypothetical protein
MYEYLFFHTYPVLDILKIQISNLGITSFDHITWNSPDELLIYFSEELSAGEQTSLTTLVTTQHPPRLLGKNFLKNIFEEGQLQKEQWYEIDNGDGTYSDLAEETIYSYNSGALLSSITTVYREGGIIDSIEEYEYYSGTEDGRTVIMKKKVEA